MKPKNLLKRLYLASMHVGVVYTCSVCAPGDWGGYRMPLI